MKYESHEIANIFPEMFGQEFDALKDDIAKNGLAEPIMVFKD